jgi:hypothetical protein
LLTYSGVQRILCCVFALFFFVLLPVSLVSVHHGLPFRYSIAFPRVFTVPLLIKRTIMVLSNIVIKHQLFTILFVCSYSAMFNIFFDSATFNLKCLFQGRRPDGDIFVSKRYRLYLCLQFFLFDLWISVSGDVYFILLLNYSSFIMLISRK